MLPPIRPDRSIKDKPVRGSITKFFNPIKSKAIDMTSDILSAVPRIKAKITMKKADDTVKVLKKARTK